MAKGWPLAKGLARAGHDLELKAGNAWPLSERWLDMATSSLAMAVAKGSQSHEGGRWTTVGFREE